MGRRIGSTTRVVIFPLSESPWKGVLLTEGPQQSEVLYTEAPSIMVGKTEYMPNHHFSVIQEEGAMNAREEYNRLVNEAITMGLSGYKPIATHFRDAATGVKRCEALASAIEAHKARAREAPTTTTEEKASTTEEQPSTTTEQPTEELEKEMRSTVKKESKATRMKRVVTNATASKKQAAAAARTSVKEKRDGIAGEFGTREGAKNDKLLLALNAKKNKPQPIEDVLTVIYGKGAKWPKDRVKFGGVLAGLNGMIEKNKLPYKIELDGKGEETTIVLAVKR